MKTTGHVNRLIIRVMCWALIMPRLGIADDLNSEPPRNPFRATDIRLTEQGQFGGQVVDAQGRAAAGIEVTLWTEGQLARRSVTDGEGRFLFGDLRAGVYQVLAPGTGSVVRVWQPAAAPPAARNGVMLVQGPIVRGQYPPRANGAHAGVYDGAVMKTLSNPWVFSGLLAAGIAVPIALSNNDNDRDGS